MQFRCPVTGFLSGFSYQCQLMKTNTTKLQERFLENSNEDNNFGHFSVQSSNIEKSTAEKHKVRFSVGRKQERLVIYSRSFPFRNRNIHECH